MNRIKNWFKNIYNIQGRLRDLLFEVNKHKNNINDNLKSHVSKIEESIKTASEKFSELVKEVYESFSKELELIKEENEELKEIIWNLKKDVCDLQFPLPVEIESKEIRIRMGDNSNSKVTILRVYRLFSFDIGDKKDLFTDLVVYKDTDGKEIEETYKKFYEKVI